MPWSKMQQKAISTYNKNILVAAAAGSGKTSVLVERVIEKIVNGICDINEILVVTFTNAAASEMRERIASAIIEKLPDKAKDRQLALLNAASISTLHAFCQKIIRENFHQIELDPKFRLASQQEIDLLKLDVIEDLFEEKYNLDDNEDFLCFTDAYGNERGDENIYDIILKLYEYAQSQPFPEKWLKSLPDYFICNNINESVWIKIIKDEVFDNLHIALINAQKMKQEAINLCLPNYEKIADEDINIIHNLLLLKNSWEDLYTAFNKISFKRMTAPRKTPDEIKDIFKNLRDTIKKIIIDLRENYFSQPLEDIASDMPILYKQSKTLCSITLDFMDNFSKAKAEKAIIDFSDLEHFTLKVLAQNNQNTDELIPTDTAKTLQHKYNEIMVDEYQDTNGVQEAILSLIASREKPNLFLVGDVKQSIYKFRLAEPELFLEKYKTYPQIKDCERIDLSQNFRSRKEILDSVNFVFSQIMTPKAAELSYGEAEALYCGFPYPQLDKCDLSSAQYTLQSPTELVLISKQNTKTDDTSDSENLQGFYNEAKYIATRLQKLIHEAPLVFDKHTKKYRALKWRDIVILLRSVQNKAQILSEVLQEANIPVYANIEMGYFQETEVRTMISLLQIIDNPQQDIPLTAVLYSPIINLNAQDLANIRLLNPQGNMYQALIEANSDDTANNLNPKLKYKIKKFIIQLNNWRDYARRHSVPELIWLLLNETGYYDYVGGMAEGTLRQANLRALYDRAAAYEKTSFRGLFRFLRFIKKMQKTGNDLSVARTLGENEDVVRVMSIHKSKGLEFPVVILADTAKQFNLKDAQNPVLFHKKLGLGLYVNDISHHIRYQTLSRQAIIKQIIKEYKAEEMRVLYVAMTRAREKLIITGSISNIDKYIKQCCGILKNSEELNADDKISSKHTLSDYVISSAKSYIDWLLITIMRHKDGSILRKHGNIESISILKDQSDWQVSIVENIDDIFVDESEDNDSKAILDAVENLRPLPATVEKEQIESHLDWHYPYETAQFIPTKLSVTEIKRRNLELNTDEMGINLYEEATFKRPQFLQKKLTLTPVEYGSLMHTVMQHLDVHGDLSDEGIKQQLYDLVDKEIIAKEHLKKIYRKNIREFLFSKIGIRLRKAKSLQRELAFSRMLPADMEDLHYENTRKDDVIFIQGVIDVLFEEDDGMVLLDYKTDNCSEDEAKEKYNIQIKLYAQAAAEIMQKPVKEKYLYLFHQGKFVQM